MEMVARGRGLPPPIRIHSGASGQASLPLGLGEAMDDHRTVAPADDAVPDQEPGGAPQARYGWSGTFRAFLETERTVLLEALRRFVPDAGPSQVGAWRDSINVLHACVQALLPGAPVAVGWGLILEYELPLEARRADAVLLAGATVVVLEFKGKAAWSDADADQTHAYARDLRCYHDACHERTVVPVLAPTRSEKLQAENRGVLVRGPAALPEFLRSLPQATADRQMELERDRVAHRSEIRIIRRWYDPVALMMAVGRAKAEDSNEGEPTDFLRRPSGADWAPLQAGCPEPAAESHPAPFTARRRSFRSGRCLAG